MGKIEVKGSASRIVDYDLMEIKLDFHAKEKKAAEASEKVMRECEEFLGTLKKAGIDISTISLAEDSVDQTFDYHSDGEKEYYKATRVLEIESKFDMKMINAIRAIVNKSDAKVGFYVGYSLSNEGEIMQELLMEALKNAKNQAEIMAQAIDQKVVGLISADKSAPAPEYVGGAEVLCIDTISLDEDEYETYENSDELSVSSNTYTETIYTAWEIA